MRLDRRLAADSPALQRFRVRTIMGLTREQMGHAQWIGHVLNRLALTDRTRKRSYAGGQMYLIRRDEVSDMMQRYEIEALEDGIN